MKKHGNQSLVSLGAGHKLNRLDNHVRLMVKCGLKFYVAIDRVTEINFNQDTIFSDPHTLHPILSAYFHGRPETFLDRIQTFPDTYVEELEHIPCHIVVCQRILPFRHWEKTIKSMQPVLILQEDLKGCELQNISGESYKKTFPGIIHYKLQPFRASRLLPSEKNIILWRRRDFFPCQMDTKPWWERLLFRYSRKKQRAEMV